MEGDTMTRIVGRMPNQEELDQRRADRATHEAVLLGIFSTDEERPDVGMAYGYKTLAYGYVGDWMYLFTSVDTGEYTFMNRNTREYIHVAPAFYWNGEDRID
jgi:hypothetical protein